MGLEEVENFSSPRQVEGPSIGWRSGAPSRETIQVGALRVRFLVEPADSNGSVHFVVTALVGAAMILITPFWDEGVEGVDQNREE